MLKKPLFLLLQIIIFVVFPGFLFVRFADLTDAAGATYFVDGASIGGACNDSNSGTSLGSPFCTIQKAATVATAGDTVQIRGGTYRETVTASQSGTANNHITYQAYNNETPVINGADVVTNWTSLGSEETGGIFSTGFEQGTFSNFNSTSIDSGNTLIATGSAANHGTNTMEATFGGGTARNARANKTITSANDVYARMYFKINSGFSMQQKDTPMAILNLRVNSSTTLAYVGLLQNNSNQFYIQGRIASPSASTFYTGTAGEIVPDTWYAVELRYKGGDASTGGAEIWLDNVSKGSNYSLNTSANTVGRIEVGASSTGGAAPAIGSVLTIDDLKSATSHVGLYSAGNPNIYKATVNWSAKTLFEDGTIVASTSATTLGEVNAANNWYIDTTNDLLYAWLPGNANPNLHTMEVSRRDKLIDLSNRSYVTVKGLTVKYNRSNGSRAGAGIFASNATNLQVQNNTITDNYGAGIYFVTTTNSTIANNTIARNMRTFGGGIRFEWGSNSNTISGNTISGQGQDAGNGIFFCGDSTCGSTGNSSNTVTGNTISNVQDTCMYLDTNNDSNLVEKNICHDSYVDASDAAKGGNGFHTSLGGDNNIFRNNLVYNMERHGISLRDGNASQGYVDNIGNTIYNNTIYNIGTHGTGNGIDIQGTNPNTVIKNNISVLLGTGTSALNVDPGSIATVVADYNLIYNTTLGGPLAKWNSSTYTSLASYQSASGTNAHSISTNPLFTNTASADFTLQSSSPAIKAGENLSSLFTNDLVSASRDTTQNYDLGAYAVTLAGTRTPTSNPLLNVQTSPSQSSNEPDLNLHPGWKYSVQAGPNYIGKRGYIAGYGEASNALTLIAADAVKNDVSVTIDKRSPQFLQTQTPAIPFPWMQGFNTVGEIYQFNALSAFNGYPETFVKPVTIVIPYNTRFVTPKLANKLKILAYDAKTKKWTILKNEIVNPANGFVAATTTSFTYFTVGYIK